MKFDWRNFTEEDYNKMTNGEEDFGQVYVGDICIELVVEEGGFIDLENETQNHTERILCNFYVAHEDTGYGYKNEHGANTDGDGMPYDYAEGGDMDMPYGLSYEEFKNKAEKLFEEFITENDKWSGYNYKTEQYLNYSLIDHANRPLEIW